VTEYVYRLTTNVPVTAGTGIGNAPMVGAGGPWYQDPKVGEITRARSNGAASADGHEFELELTEIREDIIAKVDAWISELGITMEPWQRSFLIAQMSAMRRR
jgi:hypothetical protein